MLFFAMRVTLSMGCAWIVYFLLDMILDNPVFIWALTGIVFLCAMAFFYRHDDEDENDPYEKEFPESHDIPPHIRAKWTGEDL